MTQSHLGIFISVLGKIRLHDLLGFARFFPPALLAMECHPSLVIGSSLSVDGGDAVGGLGS